MDGGTMANCGKCSAELIGSGKFCATCGAPVPQAAPVDPSGVTATPKSAVSAPVEQPVNPFAATASPSSAKQPSFSPELLAGARPSTPPPATPSQSSPPPRSVSRPPGGIGESQVSPLAVSNALSQRNAYQQLVEAAAKDKEKERASVAPAPMKAAKPGTQLMANPPARPPTPAPGSAAVPEPAPAPAKKAPARTVAMDFTSKPSFPGPGSVATPSGVASTAAGAQPNISPVSAPNVPPASAVQPGGQHQRAPQSVVQQPSGPYGNPQPYPAVHQPQSVAYPQTPGPAPAAPIAQPPYGVMPGYPAQAPALHPHAPQQAGWGYPPAAPAMAQPPMPGGFQYPFAYAPGARVHVTWSNGQRYPATVNQVSGSQCLVVFPDGQHHWVDMQYLSPGG